MLHTAMVVLGIFVLTVVMTMSGRSGGSIYDERYKALL